MLLRVGVATIRFFVVKKKNGKKRGLLAPDHAETELRLGCPSTPNGGCLATPWPYTVAQKCDHSVRDMLRAKIGRSLPSMHKYCRTPAYYK